MSWILDHLPWWVWAMAATVALAVTWPLWSSLWAVLPRPLRLALAAIAGGILLFLAGRNRGAANERDRAAARDARAEKTRREIDHEVANARPRDRDRALDRWMRD